MRPADSFWQFESSNVWLVLGGFGMSRNAIVLLDITAKWKQLEILKQWYEEDYYEADLKEKNFRSLLTVLFALLIIWTGFNSGSFVPWFAAGMIIIFVIVPLQRIDNLFIHDGKLLGILKQWDDLDEKGKIYRHLPFKGSFTIS